jgi:hypothetical protein
LLVLEPDTPADVILYLIGVGADPNAAAAAV